MLKKLFLAMMGMTAFSIANASVVINEVMPKNVSSSLNEQFQYTSWVELYNNGAEEVDITLLGIAYGELEDPFFIVGDVKKETVKNPETGVDEEQITEFPYYLQPGEYKVIYCNTNGDKAFHLTNDRLPAKKGGVYLKDASGMTIDKIVYDTTYRNVSYGRIVDGEEKAAYFTHPTPGAANDASSITESKLSAPLFSLQSGFFNAQQTVEIIAPEGSKIYYTTNGEEPSTASSLYTGPINIYKNTPLRAIAAKDGAMSSDVTTATYFINENVSKLPIVSLVTDSILLYGDSLGILVKGKNGAVVPSYCGGDRKANYQNDWDRPCNFEYFDANKQPHLNQEVKIGVFGACSRTKYLKSIKVNAGKIFGDNELDYSLFSEKPNLRWKSIVLRNAGNDFGRSYIRDGFIQTLMMTGKMDLDHQAYEPSMVFINGKFYGMLNIRERSNKDFIFSNYGYSEDEITINEGNWDNSNGKSTYAELTDIAGRSDMNEPFIYERLDELMDINEFLNYFVAEIYCGNNDWPGGNIKCWKANNGDGKWRWILYDTEYSYSVYGETNPGPTANSINKAKEHKLFKGFIKNDQIAERLLGKFAVHLQTTFQADHAIHVMDSLLQNIQPDVQRHIDVINEAHKLEEDFTKSVENMKKFARARVKNIYSQLNREFKTDTIRMKIHSDLPNATYTLNEEPIYISDFDGYYFKSKYFTVEAEEPAGYKFDHWELTNDDGTKNIKSIAYRDTMNGATTLKAVYVVDADFNPDANNIFLNEICASNSVYLDECREAEDWIEIFNNGTKTVDMSGMYLSIDKNNLGMFEIKKSDSTKVAPGEYIIFWADNDTEQGVCHTNFKLPVSTNNTLILSSLTMMGTDSVFSIIDSVSYIRHKENESFARFSYSSPSGDWKVTGKTTFGKRNIFGLFLDDPVVIAEDKAIATIYPNPVKDMLYFSFPWDEEVRATVITTYGQIVSEFTISNGEGKNLSELRKDMYILMMQTPKGKITAKLIKD